jgi:hypothetical protein
MWSVNLTFLTIVSALRQITLSAAYCCRPPLKHGGRTTAILVDRTDRTQAGERLAELRVVELWEWWATAETRATLADLARGAPAADQPRRGIR